MIRATLLAVIFALSGCAATRTPPDAAGALATLTSELGSTQHECVPLGWAPVAAGPSFYPGYSAHRLGEGWWLPPMWAVSIANARLNGADAAGVASVLNDLVRKKLLSRVRYAKGFNYYLTFRAFKYFYASNDYGDNVEAWPYLCYSTVHPTRVRWIQRPHFESIGGKMRTVYRVQFDWEPSTPAAWAQDALIRSYSVVLAPTTTPAVAKIVDWDGDWQVMHVYARGMMLPALSRGIASR